MARIVALCGGVGGAKLADGLARILAPEALAIIVNTGDDFEHLGFSICPDLDTVLYTLAGLADPVQGWGRANETTGVLDALGALGGETWFKLGDKDLALHILRRALLAQGMTATAVARVLAARLGVRHAVLPMSDTPVRTIVETPAGALAFQDYFVRERCAPQVTGFRFAGASEAALSPEVEAAFGPDLEGILICPSNPYVSIGPMLAIAGLRQKLAARRVPVLAVSPIVGGRALKGPAGKMMEELGLDVSALAIARHYAGLADVLLIDRADERLLEMPVTGGPALLVADTVMTRAEDRTALARVCLAVLDGARRA